MVVDAKMDQLGPKDIILMGENQVKKFSERWRNPIQSLKTQTPHPEDTKRKTEWWKDDLSEHLFKGEEIKNTFLDSLYGQYLEEFYGIKEEADLEMVFKKDGERFQGTPEEEKQAFGEYLLDNFSEWMRGKPSIIKVREAKKTESPKETVKENKSYNLTVNNDAYFGLSPRLKSELDKFLAIWKSEHAVEFSIATHNQAIDYVGLIGDGGKEASLPLETFTEVFDGVRDFKIEGTDKTVGFRFGENGEYIFQRTSPDLAEVILRKVEIENKKLNTGFRVRQIHYTKLPQI